ncbi:hypothetical protein NE237_005462 [Protea cynaroides]|uniref:Uncharacterized protein n=1 Tax=Protea cynaroides TaxID=273540 RepID=A0A9Q0KKI9_9MAGN|nr:hypothetical protein NE237_005462 [Protea cynaroides]
MLKTGDDILLDDQREIKEHIVAFYEGLHTSKGSSPASALLGCIPKLVGIEQSLLLDAKPYSDEVKKAIFDLNPESAPGPYGYPGKFFQCYWEIVGRDFTNDVQSFFDTGYFDAGSGLRKP